MDVATAAIIVAGCGLILNVIVAVRSAQWGLPDRLAKMEGRIMAAVEGHRSVVDDEIEKIRISLDARADAIRRDFGETVSAMREKVREVELFSRDTFMRRDSFYQVQQAMTADIRTLGEQIQSRLERMEKKIDEKT